MLRKIQFLSLVAFMLLYKVHTLHYQPNNGESCKNKHTEYFNKDVNRCCSKCHPGNGQKQKCTATSDTECEPCQSKSYSNNMNYANCFKCTSCSEDGGLIYIQKCNRTTNSKCACKEGMYCIRSEQQVCKECSPITCPPGEGVSTKDTLETDNRCEPCKDGTYSDQKTGKCLAHTNCISQGKTIIRYGNSTTDNVCGQLLNSITTRQTTVSGTTLISSTTDSPLQTTTNSSPSEGLSDNFGAKIGGVCVGLLVITLIIICTAILCLKKKADGNNNDKEANKKFLPESSDQRDPSISSTSSHSESAHGVWVGPGLVERTQQVNMSVTTTINYVLPSISTVTHTIPVPAPAAPPAKPHSDCPLSQEEVLLPSQCEVGKEARMAVQESGKDVC